MTPDRQPVQSSSVRSDVAASTLGVAAAGRTARFLLRLPPATIRRLVGPPIRLDGQRLALDMQLLLQLDHLLFREQTNPPVERVRRDLERGAGLLSGRVVQPVSSRQLDLPGPAGRIKALLYEPAVLPARRGLLVYYHGGGWVVGSLTGYDNLCRFLALRSGVRVLSVDYRLAPEHRFPAAVHDAVAAFEHAVAHAAEWGADPMLVGVGGDSAGGNLAAVVAHQAALADRPRPAFALLIYPATDFTSRRESRRMFGTGFLLTDARMTWFENHYLPAGADKADPRLSPLCAADLSGLPPTYLVTAGFDPLRDEGEAFSARLAEAGVPVTMRRQEGLVHGFANMFNASPTAQAAMIEVAAALRHGLAPHG